MSVLSIGEFQHIKNDLDRIAKRVTSLQSVQVDLVDDFVADYVREPLKVLNEAIRARQLYCAEQERLAREAAQATIA